MKIKLIFEPDFLNLAQGLVGIISGPLTRRCKHHFLNTDLHCLAKGVDHYGIFKKFFAI